VTNKKNGKIFFGLGSNLGDRFFYLDQAIENLIEHLELKKIKRSSIIENKALLKENSPKEWDLNFLNLVFSAEIDLVKFTPQLILEIIKNIEKKLGRKDSKRWSPREIDIDILAIDNLVIRDSDNLIIPHYDLLNRDFFLKLFCEIDQEWKYPVLGENFGKKIKLFNSNLSN
jgi:2-amino-4-hydroxy-6-hydroxymethyldihydropteridine diphosphokinase